MSGFAPHAGPRTPTRYTRDQVDAAVADLERIDDNQVDHEQRIATLEGRSGGSAAVLLIDTAADLPEGTPVGTIVVTRG